MSKYIVSQDDSAKYPNSSENQLIFDVFDSIPVVEKTKRPPKPKVEYYLRIRTTLGWYFLWKTHSNGGPEWAAEQSQHNTRKKPLRYKTLSGARRSLYQLVSVDDKRIFEMEVAVWHE